MVIGLRELFLLVSVGAAVVITGIVGARDVREQFRERDIRDSTRDKRAQRIESKVDSIVTGDWVLQHGRIGLLRGPQPGGSK